MKFSQFVSTTTEANQPIAAGRYDAAVVDVQDKVATTGTPMVVIILDADGKQVRFQQCFGDVASAKQNDFVIRLVRALGVFDAFAEADVDSNEIGAALVKMFAAGDFDTLTVDCTYSEGATWPDVRVPFDLSVPFNADGGSNTKPAAATTIEPGDETSF